jgi:hypothetical protein
MLFTGSDPNPGGPTPAELGRAFNEGWPKMRAAGWVAVKGRGLQSGWVYARNRNSVTNGVEGVDYFVRDLAFGRWWLTRRIIPAVSAPASPAPASTAATTPTRPAATATTPTEPSPARPTLRQSKRPRFVSPVRSPVHSDDEVQAQSSQQDSPIILAQTMASPPSSPVDSTQQAAARLFGDISGGAAEPDHEPDAFDADEGGPGSFSQLPVSSLPSSFTALLAGEETVGMEAEQGGDADDEDDDARIGGEARVASIVDDGNVASKPEELAEWDSGDEDGFEEESELNEFDPLSREESASDDELGEAAEMNSLTKHF